MGVSTAILAAGTLLKRGDSGVGAGTQASKNWGTTTSSIRILAREAGTAGNSKSVTVVSSGSTFVKTTLTATVINITIPTTATVAQVLAYLYGDTTFCDNWAADYNAVGDGSGVCAAQTTVSLSGGAAGAEVFTTISEVLSVSWGGAKTDLVEVTHMESPNSFREYISGLKDGGTVDFSINYLPQDAQQKGLITDLVANTKRNYQIVLPDTGASTWAFNALVTDFQPDAPKDGALTAKVSLKVSGQPTPPS